MKNINKYEALGFVEALVAIMVVGISSIVLMQIAVNTMQNTIQNEIIDSMTQYAVEGAEIAQDIANKDIATGENLFPDRNDWGRCFFFNSQDGIFYFAKTSENLFQNFDELNDRNVYKDIATILEEEKLFRIVCLDLSTVEVPSFVIGRIVVGQRNSDGSITKGNLVKDYSYLTVIKL